MVRCRVGAAGRTPTQGVLRGAEGEVAQGADEWRRDYETWVFRVVYASDFDVLLRKMGYHLSMIYRNVTVQCEEMALTELIAATCADCIRHLTSSAYGELGMIVPAHPDDSIRGKRTAPALNAFRCIAEGKAYSNSAPGAALFCRTRQRGDKDGEA